MRKLIVDRPGVGAIENTVEEFAWNEETQRRFSLIAADVRVLEKGEPVFDHNATAYYLEEDDD